MVDRRLREYLRAQLWLLILCLASALRLRVSDSKRAQPPARALELARHKARPSRPVMHRSAASSPLGGRITQGIAVLGVQDRVKTRFRAETSYPSLGGCAAHAPPTLASRRL